MNPIVETQLTFLDNIPYHFTVYRMTNYRIYMPGMMLRDFERENKEDRFNDLINRERITKVLDNQRLNLPYLNNVTYTLDMRSNHLKLNTYDTERKSRFSLND